MTQLVFVVGSMPKYDETSPLVYQDGPEPVVRLYEKDKIDERANPTPGKKLPFFDTFEGVIKHYFADAKPLHGEDNFAPCQIAVELLPDFGFSKADIQAAMEHGRNQF